MNMMRSDLKLSCGALNREDAQVRCVGVKMKGCEDVKMRSLDLKVCKCEMRRCEEAEKRCEGVKMRRRQDGRM